MHRHFFVLLNKTHSKTSSAPGGKHTWCQKTVRVPFLTETRKKKLKAGTISVILFGGNKAN
jgi:hypothetical protein